MHVPLAASAPFSGKSFPAATLRIRGRCAAAAGRASQTAISGTGQGAACGVHDASADALRAGDLSLKLTVRLCL
jgi:hypothetical protein